MTITKNKAVQFHYVINEGEQVLEDSHTAEPQYYLHGHKGMLPALEALFEGKQAGDKINATLTTAECYGERREDAVQRIPLKHLQGAKTWKAGMTAIVESNQGRQQVTLLKVGRFNADCDLNHPFAGKTLTFAIDVLAVRDATAEEISHGHVHAEGGCGHTH